MTYDTRGLTTQVAYTPPTGTTVPDTPTTVFTYDNLGNRTSMDTAGVSATAYSYDELSRLTAETVDFDDLTSNYSITYGYEISGKLKTVTDPFGDSVSYNNDKMGRTNSITGSSFGGVTTYAENIKFRAFGGLKEMEYGSDDSSVMSYTFDDRLRLSGYESTSTVRTSGYVRRATYEYYADGHTKAVNNQENTSFGQEYKFDNAGRISQTTSGTVTSTVHGQVALYDQTIDYSAFGDITSRETSLWGEENDFSATYTDGRKTGGTETFDALGNIVQDTPVLTLEHTRIETWAFDASGSLSEHVSSTHKSGGPNFHITHRLERSSDGDGRMVKRVETRRVEQQIPPGESETVETTYNIRSSVLGGVVTELYGNGGKRSTKVHSGSAVLAEQLVAEVGQTESVVWRHTDVVTGSFNTVKKDGTFYKPGEAEYRAEFEPLGAGLPEDDPYIAPGMEPMPQRYRTGGGWNAAEPERGCFWNGAPIPCNNAGFILRTEGVVSVEVNERSPGGFRLLATLENAFKIRKTVTRNDITIGCADDEPNCIPEGTDYGEPQTHYGLLMSPMDDIIIETSIAMPSPDLNQVPVPLGCHFNIVIDSAKTRGIYKSGGSVINTAKQEIKRIFGEAGHSVTFDAATEADATYWTTLLPGMSSNNLKRIGYTNSGTNVGGVYTGKLIHMGVVQNFRNRGGSEGFGFHGQGTALGRVISHEAIAHFLLASLGTNSSEHRGTQLTKAIFDPATLFKRSESDSYDLNAGQAAELWKYCSGLTSLDNTAE